MTQQTTKGKADTQDRKMTSTDNRMDLIDYKLDW